MVNQSVITDIHQQKIGVITLNRPQVYNALNKAMIVELSEAIDAFLNNSAISVILLKANGTHFSSGADLNWMKESANLNYEENREDAMSLAQLLQRLYQAPKPLVVAAQGNAFGGALGLIACGDIVISTPESQFCFSEVRLGLVPAVISPFVIHAMGQRLANYYFLTAHPFKGEAAQAHGLVHLLSDPSELAQQALQQCERLIKLGPSALKASKQLVREIAPMSEDQLAYTVDLIATLRTSPEGQEGLAAFLDKRKPNWITGE